MLARNRHSEIARVRGAVSRSGTGWRPGSRAAASLPWFSRGRLSGRPRQRPERHAEDRESDVPRRSVRAMAKCLHGPAVGRCRGRVWIGRTRTPSVRRAPRSVVRHRFSALSAACGLLLAVQVATARADDPQPPVTPAVPTIAVQVSVSVPNVSVNVQGGIVDISAPSVGVGVDVSVSVSSQGSLSGTKADASAAQRPTTQSDGAGNCCNAGTKQVAPAGISRKKTRVLRAAPAKRLARPTVGAPANGARARTIRIPPADRSTRLQAANQVPRPTSARLATRPKARPGCCGAAHAPIAPAVAPTRLGPRPGTVHRPDRYDDAVTRPAVRPEEHVRDNRLVLQLGVLGAFLYLACVAGWFSATRLRRA